MDKVFSSIGAPRSFNANFIIQVEWLIINAALDGRKIVDGRKTRCRRDSLRCYWNVDVKKEKENQKKKKKKKERKREDETRETRRSYVKHNQYFHVRLPLDNLDYTRWHYADESKIDKSVVEYFVFWRLVSSSVFVRWLMRICCSNVIVQWTSN